MGEQPRLREGESTWKGIVQILFLINEMFPGCTVARKGGGILKNLSSSKRFLDWEKYNFQRNCNHVNKRA